MMKDRKEEFSGISRIYEKYNPVIQFRNRGVNERMVNILNSPNFILFFCYLLPSWRQKSKKYRSSRFTTIHDPSREISNFWNLSSFIS